MKFKIIEAGNELVSHIDQSHDSKFYDKVTDAEQIEDEKVRSFLDWNKIM